MSSGLIPAEIRSSPAAIRETVDLAGEQARLVAVEFRARSVRRIFIIGNGTSYHSSLAAAWLFRRHATPDDPVVVPLTAGDFRHYPPQLGPTDAVVGVSASGEFRDVISVVEHLRGRVPTAAVVHVPNSSLTQLADHTIVAAGGPSAVPVMTKTYSSTLTAALLLIAHLFDDRRTRDIVDGVLQAADQVAWAIDAASERVSGLAPRLAASEHMFVYGSGAAYAAALEGALKLKEISLVHAEGAETWEMASGAATMIGPGACVVMLAPTGPGHEAAVELSRHCREWGAQVVEVSPLPSGTDAVLPLPEGVVEDLAPLHSVPPVALLAYELALQRGIDPDRPGWTERYRKQGMTHVAGAGGAPSVPRIPAGHPDA